MSKQNFELNYEDRIITRFLGLDSSMYDTGKKKTTKFMMAWNIYHRLVLIVMADFTPKDTLYIKITLGSYIDGALSKESEKCIQEYTVFTLHHLSRNTPSDIKLVTNQFACNNHEPKLSHDITINIIFQ